MTTPPSWPGIYISEDNAPALSVSSTATAVPAFAFDGNRNDSGMTSYNSFLEFSAQHDATHPVHKSVKFWFMQGGGRCYLFNTAVARAEDLEKYEDITLLVAAGTEITAVVNTLSNKGATIFCLLDGPQQKISGDARPENLMTTFPASAQAAAFYPWLKVNWSDDLLPPSAAAAVIFAQTDRTRGIWKAPANGVLNGVEPAFGISDQLQGQFNSGKALNMFRTFADSGTVLWGARTLLDNDNWRYIPVRRLFNMIERDIARALSVLVFESNNSLTWQKASSALSSYLHALWQQGALAGNSPAEAFFVQVGEGITMTKADIAQGKMIIKVGAAAVRPAEFITLQFSQQTQS